MSKLFEYYEANKVWTPARLTRKHDRELRELKEWLDWLTDMPYVPLHEFGSEPK